MKVKMKVDKAILTFIVLLHLGTKLIKEGVQKVFVSPYRLTVDDLGMSRY